MSIAPPPPFDPELAATLAVVSKTVPASITRDVLAEMRRDGVFPRPTDEELSRNGLFEIEERQVRGPQGAPDISLLIGRPASTGRTRPSPVLYFTHGGGMIMGDNRGGFANALDLALELDAIVVSVEYRLAPEHPHPAPIEDVYAGLLWTAQHAQEIGGDAERIVITGPSAGGGLTAALALLLRDRKGPQPIGQLLVCPMLDDRNDTPSAHQMAGLGVWDRTSNETGWTALLGDKRGGPDVPGYAAPARAEDLSGLPPAFLDVGSAETLRDEVVTYASRIWQAGGTAELHVWPGAFHGFDEFAPQSALGMAARAARLRWLQKLLQL
ncbi:alpha/beta hydrolase [Streptomyces sp. PA03-5A]|nr:alpha/beta hydrolase [Streptomyces sp. PA03-5A]